ncbi:amidase [Metapseudomonas lalkuanensis]|jgi:hypothetical protein|uniref:amidase n=1 Tax=Metapseudomonas lalkuanensis TaxID=2604832 RepID=UPI001CF16C9B|nr:amidase [Pseudomonas lalkuanensis]UCO97270.1 amidase [Pseudomonas lalkuanensis]
MIARRPVLSLFVLALILLAATAWQNRQHLAAFPGIISAYTAKEYCSCRYVMGNPADYCQGYVKQYVPTSAFLDDAEHKRVTASGLGRSNTAAWVSPQQGCRLLPEADSTF